MRQLIIMFDWHAFLLFPITFNQTHTMESIVTSHFLTDIIVENNSWIEKTGVKFILFSKPVEIC